MVALLDWQQEPFDIIAGIVTRIFHDETVKRLLEVGDLATDLKTVDTIITQIRNTGYLCTINTQTGTHMFHKPDDELRGVSLHKITSTIEGHDDVYFWSFYNYTPYRSVR